MSEEVEGRTLEQLQDMAAEQDRLSGYEGSDHPAEIPAAEIEQRKEAEKDPQPETPKEETRIEAPESKSEKPSPEPEADAGPPEVPDSSFLR